MKLSQINIEYKTGIIIIPVYKILLLLFFISVDIYTTFLGTPDLKLEANPIITYFGKNWTVLFIFNSISFLFHSLTFIIGFNYLRKKKTNFRFILTNSISLIHCKTLIAIIVCIYFYYYIIFSFLISINNFLIHLWLHTKWKPLIHWYILIVSNNPTFYISLNIVGIILGALIFIWQIKKTEKSKSNL